MGIHEKGSEDVVSAFYHTIYTFYLSLCTQTAETPWTLFVNFKFLSHPVAFFLLDEMTLSWRRLSLGLKQASAVCFTCWSWERNQLKLCFLQFVVLYVKISLMFSAVNSDLIGESNNNHLFEHDYARSGIWKTHIQNFFLVAGPLRSGPPL